MQSGPRAEPTTLTSVLPRKVLGPSHAGSFVRQTDHHHVTSKTSILGIS